MNRIATRFQELIRNNTAAFIPFITAGDPTLSIGEDIVVALADSGADIIEYGVPFSDPVGDGPVIQAASLRALSQGVTMRSVLTSIERIRKRTQIPLLIFTYYNPVFVYGENAFARNAVDAGADGVLCVDLPPDDAHNYREALREHNLDPVFLAAPTSSESRLKLIGDASGTFVYYISRLGVTGERSSLIENLDRSVRRVREITQKPVAVGFGISTPDQARAVGNIAEGVVIGSAIVRLIGETTEPNDTVLRVKHYATTMAQAIKSKATCSGAHG